MRTDRWVMGDLTDPDLVRRFLVNFTGDNIAEQMKNLLNKRKGFINTKLCLKNYKPTCFLQ